MAGAFGSDTVLRYVRPAGDTRYYAPGDTDFTTPHYIGDITNGMMTQDINLMLHDQTGAFMGRDRYEQAAELYLFPAGNAMHLLETDPASVVDGQGVTAHYRGSGNVHALLPNGQPIDISIDGLGLTRIGQSVWTNPALEGEAAWEHVFNGIKGQEQRDFLTSRGFRPATYQEIVEKAIKAHLMINYSAQLQELEASGDIFNQQGQHATQYEIAGLIALGADVGIAPVRALYAGHGQFGTPIDA